jgi:intracellular septation protein A
MLYPYLGIIWAALGSVLLYRGLSKTRQAAIQTLADSDAVLLSKRQRRWNLALGCCFLALAVANFVVRPH